MKTRELIPPTTPHPGSYECYLAGCDLRPCIAAYLARNRARKSFTYYERSKPIVRSGRAQRRSNPFDYQPPYEKPIEHLEDKPHGTPGTYKAGCRCVKCKDANSERMEKYRSPHRKRRNARV